MATAAQLEALDEAHRQAQAANAAATAMTIYSTWSSVKLSSLAQTGTTWLAQAIAAVVARRYLSELYALQYAAKVRQLQLGTLDGAPAAMLLDFSTLIPEWERTLGGPNRGRTLIDPAQVPTLPDIPPPNIDQIRESLIHVALRETAMRQAAIPNKREPIDVTARVIEEGSGLDDLLHQLTRENDTILRENQSIDEMRIKLMPDAKQRAGAASVRHTQNGGRDAVDTVVAKDLKARGYIRVCRAKCCGWCAMLASRGPVYKEDSFAESNVRFTGPGDHKVHDDCGCTLRPVYTRDGSEWTSVARDASQLWETLDEEYAGREGGRFAGKNAVREFSARWRLRNAAA